jgi:DNA recombination protein RmuC
MTEMMPIVAVTAVVVALAAVAVMIVVLVRSRAPAEPQDDVMAELAQAQGAAAQRLEAMIRMLGDRQSQLQSAVNDRLDNVTHRLGESLQKTTQHTSENLQKLHERLGVIDSAQKNITTLATQVTSLQSVLANKQERGAFGQWRMESIVQDCLPKDSYAFQHTLSNRTRPDCCVFMPDNRVLVIDAKFPLESVTAYRDAKSDEERKLASQRLRVDINKHVNDIAEKYLIPGETQDFALMFVPSEAIYAEVSDSFIDLVQKAYRTRVVLMSPSLLMLAIALVQQNQKDARMREAADQIQDEVGRLVKDVSLLGDRVRKLQSHFNQASEDIRQSIVSVEKIESRGEKIQQVDVGDINSAESNVVATPIRRLEAGE